MKNLEFKEEAKEWLKEFGYSIHSYSANYSNILFTNDNYGENYPNISCFINEYNEKRCQLIGSSLKFWINLKSGQIQFKHSDIKRYIDVMVHYITICTNNPPF